LDDSNNESRLNQSIVNPNKFIYRPLTANLRPLNKNEESKSSNSPSTVE